MSELGYSLNSLKEWIKGLDSLPSDDEVDSRFEPLEQLEEQMNK